jgi:hypothetical protein
MKQTPLFPRALAALAACVTFLVSAGAIAQGATIQLIDSNCDDFALGGSPGARTLTCVVSSAPTCTVNGPGAGSIGTQITLTANCSPAATGWSWTGGNCAGVNTQSCQDSGSGYTNGQQVNYKVTGSNNNGSGPQSTALAVTWSNTPVAPSGCTISGAPGGSVPSGTAINLSIGCTGGGQPTSWTWSGGAPCTGAVTQTCAGNITSTHTFTGTACSAPGVCSPSTPGVTVTVGGGGGGGGGGALDCSSQLQAHGWANPGQTLTIDVPWPNDGSNHLYYTSQNGGLFGNGAFVVRFTTSAVTEASGKSQMYAVEFGSSPSERRGALNTTPCDFDTGLPVTNCAGQTTRFDATGPTIYLFQSSSGKGRTCAVTLQPSTTYYFNLYNAPGATCTGQPSCDMTISFQKPGGT